jgi:hypothetical protein
MHEKPRILRRTLIWMAVAAFAIGSAFAFEHTTKSGGVMLDTLTLAANDGTCQKDHQGPNSKPDCEPCTDEHGKVHNCHKPCVKGDGTTKPDCQPCPTADPHSGETHECHKPCTKGNGDPKDPNKCVPCTDKHGKPKDCKPCKTDPNGHTHPKDCVVSDDGSVTSEEGTPTG